jgi:hypothetical protein
MLGTTNIAVIMIIAQIVTDGGPHVSKLHVKGRKSESHKHMNSGRCELSYTNQAMRCLFFRILQEFSFDWAASLLLLQVFVGLIELVLCYIIWFYKKGVLNKESNLVSLQQCVLHFLEPLHRCPCIPIYRPCVYNIHTQKHRSEDVYLATYQYYIVW